MLLDLLVNHQVPYILGSVAAFGVLLNLVEDSIYKRYLRHVTQLERKPRTWPGQLKARFETYYKRKTGVKRVDLFVKNSLDSRRFLGIRLRSWDRFSSQFPMLVLGGGLAAALYASYEHFSSQECLRLLGCGALFALAGRILERIIGVAESRERLQNALNDYFSNLLRPRMEQQYLLRSPYLLPAAGPALTVEEPTAEPSERETAADKSQPEPPVLTVEEFREQKAEHLRKKRREEREQKAERERKQQQTRLAERRRRAEERAKKQQEALQAAYEEKKRKLESKYISLQKEAAVASDFAAKEEAAAASEPPSAEKKEPPEPEKEIECTAKNMTDPDFIEEVLREYLL